MLIIGERGKGMEITVELIEEKMKEFFEREYQETKDIIERNPWWLKDKNKMIDETIHSCLGIAQFVQLCGVPYEHLGIYDEIKAKLEALKD